MVCKKDCVSVSLRKRVVIVGISIILAMIGLFHWQGYSCYDILPCQKDGSVNIIERIKNVKAVDERSKIAHELAPLFLEELKRDPKAMEGFMLDTVEVARKSGPGIAGYIFKLVAGDLHEELLKAQSKNDQLEAGLSEAKTEIRILLPFKEKATQLQKLTDEYAVKQVNHYEDVSLPNDVSTMPIQNIEDLPSVKTSDVAVFLGNSSKTTRIVIKIISQQSGKEWSNILGAKGVYGDYNSTKTIYIPPGTYKTEFYYHVGNNHYVPGLSGGVVIPATPLFSGGYHQLITTDVREWGRP